jgi:hypothetical protein
MSVLFGSALSSGGEAGGSTNMSSRAKESVITPELLGGDERYLLYVSLDKPVYRESESVYIRTTILNASDNTPLDNGSADIQVQIKGPKGDIVFDTYTTGDDSTVGAKWVIPAATAGGRYSVLVSSPSLGAPQTERAFDIRAYRVPRLKSQIEFTREGYGAGDKVQASIKIDRAEGGVPTGAVVTVIARVDGGEVFRKPGLRVGKSGILSTEFALPDQIEVGEGSLAFVIEDGGVVETASKTLPIILQTLAVQFYPEGGDLVAGLVSRIYVQANKPDGKPADIQGRIFELREGAIHGDAITKFATSHEGRGVFSFAPMTHKNYALALDAPSGIDTLFKLPVVKANGAVLTSVRDTFAYDSKVSFKVSSKGPNPVAEVTLYKRDQLLDMQSVSSDGEIALNAKDAEGVLIVTAWSASGKPLAERLIYRQPKFAVNVSLSVSKGRYVPGDEVSVDIVTTDENGKPVEAVVGVTVTDDAVLEIIEKREQAPQLPVMVYLENDVSDLADAHVYLDAGNEKAPAAVDLLLGTQGWRRFALVNYQELKQHQPEAIMRAMAERTAPVVQYDQMMLEEVVLAGARNKRVFNRREAQAPMAMAMAEVVDQAEAVAPVALVAEPAPAVGKLEAEQDFRLEPKRAMAKIANADAFGGAFMPRQNIIVREYAHKVRANRKANDRVDFTETVYWHKGVRTSARDGKATIKFGLSDSVSSFRMTGDAFGRNGALGSGETLISSVEPFYIEPKMPLEVSVGDVIELPVAMINASTKNINTANLLVTSEGLTISQAKSARLDAGARIRRIVTIVAEKPGRFPLVLTAAAGPFTDRVMRTLTVKPKGFPVSVTHGGLIGPQTEFSTQIVVPDAIELGSLVSVAKVYPSPLANMEEALNALLRQPNGCFEQTSSSNYPLVMAQQYFVSHQGVNPEKIAKAKELLTQGYKKLIGFESKDQGYEWFGANPAHEALTAYGLMEFVDMAKVMPVDEAMIKRTRAWLLSRRDGEGGFKRNSKSIDSFGSAPIPTTNAYILWALLESGESAQSLRKEIAAVKAQALETKDSYVLALAANILYLAADKPAATKLSQRLVDMVVKSGAVSSAETSITRSGGDSLLIETTSLALLAWLKDDSRWAAQVETSMKWLFERSQSGRFGSTQSTILALKAINAYDAARAKPKKPGSVQLLVDGSPFGKPVLFDEDSKGAIELPDFSAALTSGAHTLSLKMDDGSKMPFAVEVSYNTPLPLSNEEASIELETHLSASTVAEGELLELQVSVTVGDKIAPTPMAIIGVPAGLEVRHDQLKELVGANKISSYEVNGRELILYWRALQAKERRKLVVSLVASVPGSFTGPASRTYLYYTDELKHWRAGHKVTVVAK